MALGRRIAQVHREASDRRRELQRQALERQREATGRQREAAERQREAAERLREAAERVQEDEDRQRESQVEWMLRQREAAGRQREAAERQRERQVESMLRQRDAAHSRVEMIRQAEHDLHHVQALQHARRQPISEGWVPLCTPDAKVGSTLLPANLSDTRAALPGEQEEWEAALRANVAENEAHASRMVLETKIALDLAQRRKQERDLETKTKEEALATSVKEESPEAVRHPHIKGATPNLPGSASDSKDAHALSAATSRVGTPILGNLRQPVQTTDDGALQCSICLDSLRVVSAIPCGCRSICLACCRGYNAKTCPICRHEVAQWLVTT